MATGMPDRMTVGTAVRLWRYPVKSMLGEETDAFDVVWSGVYGNRCYALVDQETSKLVSAKNPAKWGRMFECSSRLAAVDGDFRPTDASLLPSVQVVLPGGQRFEISDGVYAETESALSRLFGREVKFTAARADPRSVTMEEYHPEIEEEAKRGMTTDFVRPITSQAGTFTDGAAIHLVTTATLRELSALDPAGNFDPLRFRPNMLVDTGESSGFVEREWVGKNFALGDEVVMKVFAECGRCVMTTLSQGELASDVDILRTVKKHNRGKTGVFASVLKGGRVKKGDDLTALK